MRQQIEFNDFLARMKADQIQNVNNKHENDTKILNQH